MARVRGSDERGEIARGRDRDRRGGCPPRPGRAPHVDERLDGRHERVGLDEHLVARANAGRARAEAERIGARRDALRVTARRDTRPSRLSKRAQLVAAEQLHAIEHALARSEQFAADAVILTGQLDQPHPRPRA